MDDRYEYCNKHKNFPVICLEVLIKWFMELYHESGYITIQKRENSSDTFTVRKIQNVIVAGNTFFLENPPSESCLDSSNIVVDFDRIWVFLDEEKLKNYLEILLKDWYDIEYKLGNVDTWKDFGKEVTFWDNASFVRTGYHGGCKWDDTLDDTTFGIRKPKELMEKLTGEKFDTWYKAENDL